jgi:hypothetical protein
MTGRRHMGAMLTELGDGVLLASQVAPGIRVKRLEVDLPVEIAVECRGDSVILLSELPRFTTRTAFDPPINRLRVIWEQRDG